MSRARFWPYRFAIAVTVLGSVAACHQANSSNAEVQQLMETSRAWSRTAATGNEKATLNYWADDAVLIMPGQPVIRGKDAIRNFLKQSFRIPGFRIRWQPKGGYVSSSGDLGYLIEDTQVSSSDEKGGIHTEALRAVTVWRKQPDGSWKNVVDISSPA